MERLPEIRVQGILQEIRMHEDLPVAARAFSGHPAAGRMLVLLPAVLPGVQVREAQEAQATAQGGDVDLPPVTYGNDFPEYSDWNREILKKVKTIRKQ